MVTDRRSILTGMATLGLASSASAVTSVREPLRRGRQIIVGIGGEFREIRDALAAITDNSYGKRYGIVALPGSYGAFDAKEYVDIAGSGVKSTIIETGGDDGQYVRLNSNMSLSNLGIRYTGKGAADIERGAIELVPGNQTELVLRDLEIDVRELAGATAPKYAIHFNEQARATAWNVRIATESGGIRVESGQTRWHNCDVYLRGTMVGLPHYGVVITGGNRFDFYGGRIGTGYYYNQDLLDPDQDVIGLLIPATNSEGNCRAEIHDAEMFARNITPAAGVRVNAVRAENGWARLYGCFCQTEISPDANGNGSKTLHAAFRSPAQPVEGKGGRIEAYGCRVRDFEGYVIGGPGLQGAVVYTSQVTIERYENLCLCDAADGPFSIFLPNDVPETDGDEHVFKKIDAGANVVTIEGNGNLIDDMAAVQLNAQYQTLRVRRFGANWYVV